MPCLTTFCRTRFVVAAVVLLVIVGGLSTAFAYDWKTAPAPGNAARSMAVGPDKGLWLATQDSVGRWRDGEWEVYPLNRLPSKSCTPTISFSPSGSMYMTYSDPSSSGVICVYWGGDDWRYEQVFGKGKSLYSSCVAYGPDGTPYAAVISNEVLYLVKRGRDGVWTSRIIDDTNRAHKPDLHISKSGVATIAYSAWTSSSVTIAEGPADGELVIRKYPQKGDDVQLEFTADGKKIIGYSDAFDGEYFIGTMQPDGQLQENKFEVNKINPDGGHVASYSMVLVGGATPLVCYVGTALKGTWSGPLRMARFEGKTPEKCAVVDDRTVASTYQGQTDCVLIGDTLYVSYTVSPQAGGCISWTKLPSAESK